MLFVPAKGARLKVMHAVRQPMTVTMTSCMQLLRGYGLSRVGDPQYGQLITSTPHRRKVLLGYLVLHCFSKAGNKDSGKRGKHLFQQALKLRCCRLRK